MYVMLDARWALEIFCPLGSGGRGSGAVSIVAVGLVIGEMGGVGRRGEEKRGEVPVAVAVAVAGWYTTI